MTVKFSPSVEQAIQDAAKASGMDPATLRAIVKIESGGDPSARTGSYSGLMQLSPGEFKKYSAGDINDPEDNASAGALKLKDESASFKSQYGRDPTAGELYLIHQQGAGGAAAHWAAPDAPAWQNMASTGEGRAKGDDWAKRAIWGNVPDDQKAKFGSVDNITSGQFAKLWDDKITGGMGPADAPVALPTVQTALNSPGQAFTPDAQSPAASAQSGQPLAAVASAATPGAFAPALGADATPAPAASVPQSFAGSLASLVQPGAALDPKALAAVDKDASAAIPKPPSLNLTGLAPRPLDLSKLAAIAQSRSTLGTA